jgi:osmotically-inducible protein OsmY
MENFMKTDREIQNDVMDELAFDPSVIAEDIGVSVKNQVVSLSGTVPTYAEKHAAEKATFRVAGVKAVADEIKVKLLNDSKRSDQDIAKAAADALEWNVAIPAKLEVSVEDGKVFLNGKVNWEYQREAATSTVRHLKGVTGIVNNITVQSGPQPKDIKERIEKALVRAATDDARHINIDINDGKVILTGKVHSRSEIVDAKWAAWAVPGVTYVESKINLI